MGTKTLRAASATIVCLVLAACGGVGVAAPRGIVDGGALSFTTSGGYRQVSTADGGVTFDIPGAIASPKGESLYAVADGAQGPELRRFDARTGAQTGAVRVPGGFEAAVASDDGLVALVEAGTPTFPEYPEGRSTTQIQIIDMEGVRTRSLAFRGNIEPEAFNMDGSFLFAISYQPPEDPDRYTVMASWLGEEDGQGDGSLTHIPTGDPRDQPQHKVPVAAMRGDRIQQAYSPDGETLYTLYESFDPDGHGVAFVHVLDRHHLTAHCIDLPAAFATTDKTNKALALHPDGERLFVTDSGIDQVARIRTSRLVVADVVDVDLPEASPEGDARAAISDGMLWVSGGPNLGRYALDEDLAPREPWRFDRAIQDLLVAPDGSRAMVLTGDDVILRSAEGELGRVALTGARALRSYGPWA